MSFSPFGHVPETTNLTLSKGADFVQVIEVDGQSLPAGTTATIYVTDTSDELVATWPGAVNGTSVKWVVQSDAVDLIEAGSKYRLIVSFPTEPTTEYCWFYGRIQRRQ